MIWSPALDGCSAVEVRLFGERSRKLGFGLLFEAQAGELQSVSCNPGGGTNS